MPSFDEHWTELMKERAELRVANVQLRTTVAGQAETIANQRAHIVSLKDEAPDSSAWQRIAEARAAEIVKLRAENMRLNHLLATKAA